MSKLTRRLLSIMAVVVVAIALVVFAFADPAQEPEATQEPVCYEHGDVNGDGVVNNKDAIYIMYRYMFGDTAYPIEQLWDYNKDGKTNNQDAIYVMYHYMFEDDAQYQLEGTIHDYYDPTWTWDEASKTAQVVFKCGCGEPSTYTTENGVTVTAGAVVPATCVAAGSETYVASITVGGNEYTNTYVKTLPAGIGHNMVGTPDCINGSGCSLCDYTLPALGHSWVLQNTVGATCSQDAYQVYSCSACGEPKTEVQEGTAGHVLNYLEDRQEGTCKFVKWYKCANCDYTVAGTAASDTYYNHTYTAELTTDANCVSAGVKTYTCTCGDSYTEDIPQNDSHAWVKVETQKGENQKDITTYTCSNSGCDATKTTVEVTEETELKTEELTNELQLEGGAAMSLDQNTVNALDENKTIKVSVTPLAEDHALLDKLSAQQKEQIGTNTVYDFNLTYSDGSSISGNGTQFAGEVTISLPYTLGVGEDVDSIDVWYIDDDGNATRVTGTYSNGFVTFTTTHFSYYTVTRLTPAERCERYGHILVKSQKAATCTQDGYDMSVCQRCGYVEKNEVLPHLEHDYTETVTAATCDAAGTSRKVCQRASCGHTVVTAIPALSHDLQKDPAQTVAASCTAAGKEVYVCSREGCNHKREDAIAQLSHNYEVVEEKAADCTSKGYIKSVCTLCEDTVLSNETLPMGHIYGVSGWQWSEDHYSATVTLACSRDCTNTKTLSAVVTEKKESATCMGAGAVTYTATASFNQVSYTDSYTQSVDAVGHKPGTEWVSDGAQHYHICTVCEEKVDATSHTWDAGTVTEEPTCNEPGTAVYKCTVCAKEQTKAVPATREHTYVDGVCSVCGREDSGCLHARTTPTELDLTGYNICADSYITRYSCECGENVYYDYSILCNFNYDEEKPETVIIDGKECQKYTYTCSDCGMVMTAISLRRAAEDECALEYAVIINLYMGDQEIVEMEWVEHSQKHGGTVLVATVDLTGEEYGLCGEVLELYTCGCEKALASVWVTESCKWNHVSYDQETGLSTFKCTSCGAVKKTSYTYDEEADGCEYMEINTRAYYVNDVEVYRVESQYLYEEHNWTAEDYELFGDDCTDGVYYQLVCKECGAIAEDYYEGHWAMVEETVDLSGYEFCASAAEIEKCPCGKEMYVDLKYPEGKSCQWGEVVTADAAPTLACQVCGVVKKAQYKSEKDENCVRYVEELEIYTDKNGQVILIGGNKWVDGSDHEYEIIDVILNGDSCEDGYKMKERCKDCGYTYTYRGSGHMTYEKEVYDLSALGMCQESATLMSCACGYRSYFNWTGDTYCNWEFVGADGDEDWSEAHSYCNVCDTYYMTRTEDSATDDPCTTKEETTIQFYKLGEEEETELLRFSYGRYYQQHDMRATFRLNDSEKGCDGGYTVTETCVRCAKQETWTVSSPAPGYHGNYLVDKQILSSDKLCGDIIVYSYSCPCGDNYSTEYDNYACNWQYMGSNTYKCSVCNTVQTWTTDTQKVEGNACKRISTSTYTYTNGEEELFAFDAPWVSYNHRNTYTFQMYGSSCFDGFEAIGTCLECGVTSTQWEGGCYYTFPVERETITAISPCGSIDMVYRQCACGDNISGWTLDDSCNWSHQGYDEKGYTLYKCLECDIEQHRLRTSTRIPDTCEYEEKWALEFVLGEETVSYEKTFTRKRHTEIAVLTPMGDTCEAGYNVTWKCVYCGEVGESGMGYGHATYRTAYYDLADYGMCGGEISCSSCACGQESSWYWSLGACNGRGTGKIDPDTGDTLYYCSNCESYFSWGEDGERNTDTCYFEGNFYFKLIKGEETLINVRGTTRHESHDTRIVNATLMNPNGTCEDGVEMYWQCRDCSYGWTSTQYGHSRYVVDEVETGCGGTIEIRRCACGAYSGISRNNNCSNTTGRNWQNTGDDGLIHYFQSENCSKCGLQILKEWYNEPLEGCRAMQTDIYTVTCGEKTVTVQSTEEVDVHEFGEESVALAPGSTSCMDGYITYRTCEACGYSESWHNSGYHRTVLVETVDLTQLGACCGVVKRYGCACGAESYYNLQNYCSTNGESGEATDEAGDTYYYEKHTCKTCGLYLENITRYGEIGEYCQVTQYDTLTVRCGDNERVINGQRETAMHDYTYTYTLAEGAETCEDGIVVHEYCTACGQTDSWQSTGHATMLVEAIDLTAYGSICGGKLNRYACACGERQYSYLDCEDGCDLDEQSIDHWIENVLDTYQENMGYNGNTYSYSYLYKCAVTDPQACGMTIRMSSYWLKEGCYAVQYEIWQLGYDEETGTCLKELHYATGEKHGFHNFTTEDLTATTETGRTEGTKYTCADCGSWVINRNTYDTNGNRLTWEKTYENNLPDAEYKYYSNVETYDNITSDRRAITLDRYDYIDANGVEGWYQYAYTYDVDNCMRLQVNTYSDGRTEEHKSIYHFETYYSESQSPTCSQPGYYHWWYECEGCKQITNEYTNVYDPGHDWHWDSELQTYVCWSCGLKNAVGADGSIIMEDLTMAKGNDVNYVIGYYNPENIDFKANVSVILDNAEGDDNQIDLGITDFTYYTTETDGFTGLSFNKEAADAAAAAAVAALENYQGTYAIRISLVPVGGTTLDYAITFDSVTAE